MNADACSDWNAAWSHDLWWCCQISSVGGSTRANISLSFAGDFDTDPFSAEFLAGELTATTSVSVADDLLIEALNIPEGFTITISSVSPAGSISSSSNSARGTILDNDGKHKGANVPLIVRQTHLRNFFVYSATVCVSTHLLQFPWGWQHGECCYCDSQSAFLPAGRDEASHSGLWDSPCSSFNASDRYVHRIEGDKIWGRGRVWGRGSVNSHLLRLCCHCKEVSYVG